MPQDTFSKILVYCDESRDDNKSRYMLLGGLWIPQQEEGNFEDLCTQFRKSEEHLLNAEFKWYKAGSKNFLPLYKQFVDIFFQCPKVRFNCIVIDKHKLDISRFHQGDQELAFYKFYFFLLSRNMNPQLSKYLVYLDRRPDKKKGRLEDLLRKLNEHFSYNGAEDNVVLAVEPRDSKASNAIQMTDVLLGAIGYHREGYRTSLYKLELMKHIATKKSLIDQKIRSSKFNIWTWQSSYA